MPWMIRPGSAPMYAAVAADLGLVAYATQRDADELASSERAIDLPSDVLPTPGADEAESVPSPASLRTARKDALLDLLEVVDRRRGPRLLEIQPILGALDQGSSTNPG
jgi:hypothetical protein